MADSKVSELKNLISNPSTIDEVRDRTIFVKIKSQLHPWSDVEIMSLFSEFGMIEEVKLLSVGSKFHSQIRYQTIYDSEWACYYYQDGWFVHQDCCEIQVYRAAEVISWDALRTDRIQVADAGEDSSVERIKPNSAKEPSGLAAQQVFDEMPKSSVNGESITAELVFDFEWEAPPMGSIKELDCVNIKAEYEGQDSSHFVLEVEPISSKEPSDFTAHQVLDKMPSKQIRPRDEFLSENVDLNQQATDLRVLAATQRTMDGYMDPLKLTKVVDMSANGIISKEMFVAEYALQDVDEHGDLEVFKDEMTMFTTRLMSFDPGGLAMLNSFGSLIANAEFYSNHCVEKMIFDLGGDIEGSMLERLRFGYALGYLNSVKWFKWVANAVCFDPGGTDLSYSDLIIILPNGSLDSEANEEKDSIQIASTKAAVKEISYLIAHHLFDKIPDSSDCHPYKLLNECGDDYLNQYEMKIPPTLGAIRLGHEAEKKVRHWSGGAMIFLYKLLNFDIAKDHNFSSAERLTILANALVGMASEEIFKSAYGLLAKDVVCLDVICFDPGGGINVINAYNTMTVNDAKPSIDANKESLMFNLGGAEFIFGVQIGQSLCYFSELLKVRKLFGALLVGIIMNEARSKHKYKRAATWSVATIYVQQVVLFGFFKAGILQVYGDLAPCANLDPCAGGQNFPRRMLVGAYKGMNPADYICNRFQAMEKSHLIQISIQETFESHSEYMSGSNSPMKVGNLRGISELSVLMIIFGAFMSNVLAIEYDNANSKESTRLQSTKSSIMWQVSSTLIYPFDKYKLLKLFDMKGGLICDILAEKVQDLDKSSTAPFLLFLCINLVRIVAVKDIDLVPRRMACVTIGESMWSSRESSCFAIYPDEMGLSFNWSTCVANFICDSGVEWFMTCDTIKYSADFVFDPGGSHVELDHRVGFAMLMLVCGAYPSLILEDKDLLNKGELL